jgi:hypothetical protein
MSETPPVPSDDRKTPIMVYTSSSLARGTVTTLPVIRVSTWMRTQAAPDYFKLAQANVITAGIGGTQNLSFDELLIPTAQVIAYHIQPPAADPVDYDPSEPNRKLEPVTVLIGNFRFNGSFRMASQSYLSKYLETAREAWTSLYDVDISNPGLPAMGTIHVQMALLRISGALMSVRVQV